MQRYDLIEDVSMPDVRSDERTPETDQEMREAAAIIEPLQDDSTITEIDEFNDSVYEQTSLAAQLVLSATLLPKHKQMAENLYRHLTQPSDKLRPHQVNALNQYCNGLLDGKLHCVFPMTMGSGKTVIAAYLIQYLLKNNDGAKIGKVLITSSKINLTEQIARELEKHCDGFTIKINMRDGWDKADIVVATDAAVKRANASELAHHFDILIVDEAHKSLGKVGVDCVRQFIENNCIVLPMTATPINDTKLLSESKGVRSCYELIRIDPKMNAVRPYNIMIGAQQEVLSPVRAGIIKPRFSVEIQQALQLQIGDIQEERLGSIIDTPEFNRLIVKTYVSAFDHITTKRFLGQQAIVFCAGVNHAENVAAQLNQLIDVDQHEYLRGIRESYVQQKYAEACEKNLPFNAMAVRSEFCVAKAIHAGSYSIKLDEKGIELALERNSIRFTNPRTNREQDFHLTPEVRRDLLTQKSKNANAKVAVLPALTKDEKAKALQLIADGGVLVACGADMLIEGADFPNVGIILNARGTASLVLHAQRCGRAMRKVRGKVAIIIEFALDLPKQVFFYDIAAGRMALGKQDQPQIDENLLMPVIEIPGCLAASELAWDNDEMIASINPNSAYARRNRARNSTTGATAKEQTMEHVVEKLSNVMRLLGPKLSLLEEQLTQSIGFVRQAPEVEKEHKKSKSAKVKTTQLATVEKSVPDAEELQLRQLNRQATQLVDRLNVILQSLNELDEVEPIAAPAKLRRGANEEQVTGAVKIAPPQAIHHLKDTLSQLNGLRIKIDKLTQTNITNNVGGSLHAENANVVQREEKEDDVATLIEAVVKASSELEATHAATDFEKICERLCQAANEKQEREARREVAAPVAEIAVASIPIPPADETPLQNFQIDPDAELAAMNDIDRLLGMTNAVEESVPMLSAEGNRAKLMLELRQAILENDSDKIERIVSLDREIIGTLTFIIDENGDKQFAPLLDFALKHRKYRAAVALCRYGATSSSSIDCRLDKIFWVRTMIDGATIERLEPEDFYTIMRVLAQSDQSWDFFNATVRSLNLALTFYNYAILRNRYDIAAALKKCALSLMPNYDPNAVAPELLNVEVFKRYILNNKFNAIGDELQKDPLLLNLILDSNGMTALTYALSKNKREVAEYLILKGADTYVVRQYIIFHPGDIIKLMGSSPQFFKLVKPFCNDKKYNEQRDCLLYFAVVVENLEACKTLIQLKANPTSLHDFKHRIVDLARGEFKTKLLRIITEFGEQSISREMDLEIQKMHRCIYNQNLDGIKKWIMLYPNWVYSIPYISTATIGSIHTNTLKIAVESSKFKAANCILDLYPDIKKQPYTGREVINIARPYPGISQDNYKELHKFISRFYPFSSEELLFPIRAATEGRNPGLFKFYLTLGADPFQKHCGKTCLDLISDPAYRKQLMSIIEEVKKSKREVPQTHASSPHVLFPPDAARTEQGSHPQLKM